MFKVLVVIFCTFLILLYLFTPLRTPVSKFISGFGLNKQSPPINKFDWLPTESAPKDYPVQIIEGFFLSPEGERFKMPSGKIINKGWGKMGSIFMTGEERKAVPSSLQIQWYSFVEDSFYKINLRWDAKKVQDLFSKPYPSPVDDKSKTFDYLMVGMAPGGGITVWLFGEQVVLEIANGQAETFDYPWDAFFPTKQLTRDAYRRLKMKDVMDPQQIEKVLNSEIPKQRFIKEIRQRYNWRYKVSGEHPPLSVHTDFINAEREYLHFNLQNEPMHEPRAIPQTTRLRWTEGPQVYQGEITFDEEEFRRTMKLLAEKGNDPVELKLQIQSATPALNVLLGNQNSTEKLESVLVQVKKMK